MVGSNLGAAYMVHFGGASAYLVKKTQLTNGNWDLEVEVPAGTLGATVDVTVTNSLTGATWTSPNDQFTYTPPPSASAISPGAGPLAGGTPVYIFGRYLGSATAVDFGGWPAQAVPWDVALDPSGVNWEIEAITPACGAGQVDVIVVTGGGSDLPEAFTYCAAPRINGAGSGVSPSAGPLSDGAVVTLSGTNLAAATAVSFGGVPADSFTANPDGSITAVVPAGTRGKVDVQVTTPGGQSTLANGYTYCVHPRLPP